MGEMGALVNLIVGLTATYGLPTYCIVRIGRPEIHKGNVGLGVTILTVSCLLMIIQTGLIIEGLYKFYHRRRLNPQN